MATERSPIHIRLYRAKSWMERAQRLVEIDPDGCFIFYWIAFNALYGQPKYLKREEGNDKPPPEEEDIENFLELMIDLDTERRLRDIPRSVLLDCDELRNDAYLSKHCWREWDKSGRKTAAERELYRGKRGSNLIDLFQRLYVLRNQIFHGCSTDGSTKNRDSIQRAVKVLHVFVPLFHKLINTNQVVPSVVKLLGKLPYPPSIGGTG